MYWTRRSGYILQGGMDGSDVRIFISGLVQYCGRQFDGGANRLYWADEGGKRIQSSNDQGSDVRTHVNTLERPFGMAFLNGWLYWGHYNALHGGTQLGDDTKPWCSASGHGRCETV